MSSKKGQLKDLNLLTIWRHSMCKPIVVECSSFLIMQGKQEPIYISIVEVLESTFSHREKAKSTFSISFVRISLYIRSYIGIVIMIY